MRSASEQALARCSESQAARAATAIIGSFRRNDADDAEVYYQAIKRILSAYPPEVVAEAADPLTGIAGKQTFLPSPAELKADLDRRMVPLWREAERERTLAEMRHRRLECEREPTKEEKARVTARLAAFKSEVAAAAREGLGASEADWVATPDAPGHATLPPEHQEARRERGPGERAREPAAPA